MLISCSRIKLLCSLSICCLPLLALYVPVQAETDTVTGSQRLSYSSEYESVVLQKKQLKQPLRLGVGKLKNELAVTDSRSLPVQVTADGYDTTTVRSEDGSTSKSEILLYEVSSCAPDHPYSWSMFSRRPLFEFAVFPVGPGENYLVWVTDRTICLTQLPKNGRSRQEAAEAHYSREYLNERQSIDVFQMLGDYEEGKRFFKVAQDNYHNKMTITSLEKNDDGRLTIQVLSSDGNVTFTFSNSGGQWHRVT